MSDLRPKGVEIELGGQKRNLLFTINAIDEIQARCNMPLIDVMQYAAKAADGKMDHETLDYFRAVVTTLVNDADGEQHSEKEVGRFLTLENYRPVAWKVLEAYGRSMPDPDEDEENDEEEDGDENPKAGTGQ